MLRQYRKRWLVLTPEKLYTFRKQQGYHQPPTEEVRAAPQHSTRPRRPPQHALGAPCNPQQPSGPPHPAATCTRAGSPAAALPLPRRLASLTRLPGWRRLSHGCLGLFLVAFAGRPQALWHRQVRRRPDQPAVHVHGAGAGAQLLLAGHVRARRRRERHPRACVDRADRARAHHLPRPRPRPGARPSATNGSLRSAARRPRAVACVLTLALTLTLTLRSAARRPRAAACVRPIADPVPSSEPSRPDLLSPPCPDLESSLSRLRILTVPTELARPEPYP